MPEMRNPNYDPRHALGDTYMLKSLGQEARRHDSLAGDIGQRIIYYTLVGAASILTLATTARIARKITK